MPLTRGELKALVKELIVEVLSEGLGNVQAAASRPLAPGRMPIQGSVREGKANGRTNGTGRRQPEFDSRLDTPVAKNPILKEQIKLNSGGNPVMAAILADTAATTLQKLSGDSRLGSAALEEGAAAAAQGSRIPQVEQINGSPEEVFGEEAAARWSSLAFAAPKKPA